MGMTNAQLKAVRDLAHRTHDAKGDAIVTIFRTSEGFEVRRGGVLLGITQTYAGAEELAR